MAAVKALEARDRDGAALFVRSLVEENPPLGDTWGSVSRLASTLGEVSIAVTAARRYMREAPGDRERRLFAGAVMASHGQVENAIETVASAASRYPNDPSLRHFLGTCRAQLGQPSLAIRELRQSLSVQRMAAAAVTWVTLADLKTFAPGDPDLVALQHLIDALKGIDDMQGAALFALGKALDDTGDTEGAFQAYDRGAALLATTRPYDAQSARTFVDRMIAGSTPAHQASLPQSRASSARPIFVLGAPRSGSTLVEQMLVSHSAVNGGAEVNLFQRAAMAMGSLLPDDQAAFTRQPNADSAWTSIGEAYLHLLNERFGSDGRVVDKTLNHSRLVGMIASVLPGAKFVWLRREPAATAWSCFKTHFSEGLDWTWSQEAIAGYLRDEDRLHAHWTALMPDAILTVPYECLVTDPNNWVPKILSHCALEMEAATLDFQNTRRAVQTASVSQVRRPLYTDAVEGWRRYESHLRPFLDAYRAPEAH